MKFFNPFFVALTIFVFIFPATAQKQRQKAVKTPLVPCTLPLEKSPNLRGIQLGQFKPLDFKDGEYPFIASREIVVLQPPKTTTSIFPSATPSPKRTSILTPELSERMEKLKESGLISKPKPGDIPPDWVYPYEGVKRIDILYYGRGNQQVFNFKVTYNDDDAVFENEEAIKQLVSESLEIPVGSFVTIQDPDLIRKLIGDTIYQVSNLTTETLYPELKFWKADCNGWRTVFFTSLENRGLSISIMNSYVMDNLEKLKKDDEEKIRKFEIEKTKTKLKKL